MKDSNIITKILNIKYPIVQAPMNWLTSAEMVAAVSNSGGLGVLGPNAGQTEISGLDKVYSIVRNEIKKTKKLTQNSFGINILLPSSNVATEATLKAAFDENVKFYVTVGDADREAFKMIKENSGVIIHRPLTPTVENMKEAESFGADILVTTGYDEGGVIPNVALGTFTILPTIVDSVKIPVLAAGGINDKRGVTAALALGAQGVYVGTRFLITKESPMHPKAKELVIKSGIKDLLFASSTQRSIKTSFAEELHNKSLENNKINADVEISKNGGLRTSMLEGKIDKGIISVNTGIDLITREVKIGQLIEELMN